MQPIKILKILLITGIFVFATTERFSSFEKKGGDFDTYEQAVIDLLEGKNPYARTVKSYERAERDSSLDYAYLPGIMYIHYILYVINIVLKQNLQILQKIPVLFADIGIGLLLIKNLYKKSYPATLLALVIWFFNPYFLIHGKYTYWDPLPILFMLLALDSLEKDSVKTGAFYAISVALKTFPIFLLPIFIIKSKEKVKFLLSGAMVALAISIPFVNNLKTYIQGSLLVHGNRYLQGRPLLFYISYNYSIEFFRTVNIKVYTYVASLSGWVISTIILLKDRLQNKTSVFSNKYVVSIIPFLTFYLFTPVFNRTYLLWFLPVFILGIHKLFEERFKLGYYIILMGFFAFYYWYLVEWQAGGFHITHKGYY